MEALYAFMRHTDDLGDSSESLDLRQQALNQWRETVEQVLVRSESSSASPTEVSQPLKTSQPMAAASQEASPSVGLPLLPALADTVQRYSIPSEYLFDVIEGVAMDLTPRRYQTFEELAVYCEKVASAVGLACIHIWGFSSDRALRPARQCGLALQITNIIRDLKEDIERDRLYLPMSDLQQCRYTVEDLQQGVVDERFEHLLQIQIDRARQFYHEATELNEYLEPEGQRIFGMMLMTYYRLLGRIDRRRREILSRRIRLNRWEKVGLAVRWFLFPSRRITLR